MAPPNDDIQNAIRVFNRTFASPGSDVQPIETATLQPSEPPHAPRTKSVWYYFVANTAGTFSVGATGAGVTFFRYRSTKLPTDTDFSDIFSTANFNVEPGDICFVQVMQ